MADKYDTLKEKYNVGQNKRKRCHRPVAGSGTERPA